MILIERMDGSGGVQAHINGHDMQVLQRTSRPWTWMLQLLGWELCPVECFLPRASVTGCNTGRASPLCMCASRG